MFVPSSSHKSMKELYFVMCLESLFQCICKQPMHMFYFVFTQHFNNTFGSRSVLQFAVQGYTWEPENSLEVVKELTKEGRITQRDVLGKCLAFAVALGYTDIVRVLLAAGADPNYYNKDDDYYLTPLIGIIFENEQHDNHPEIARMLLTAGANIAHNGRSGTVYNYAADYNREDIIEVLNEWTARH